MSLQSSEAIRRPRGGSKGTKHPQARRPRPSQETYLQPAGALRDHVCVEVPETRNAKTPDGVHLAYHVVGDGPVDVLWLHTFPRRIGGAVGARPHSRAYGKTQLVRARIRYDMRATRLSDRHPPLPDLETQVRDLLAVLDVVGSWSTVIVSAGSPAGPLFAATCGVRAGLWRRCAISASRSERAFMPESVR